MEDQMLHRVALVDPDGDGLGLDSVFYALVKK
jgi:hypothetical protein